MPRRLPLPTPHSRSAERLRRSLLPLLLFLLPSPAQAQESWCQNPAEVRKRLETLIVEVPENVWLPGYSDSKQLNDLSRCGVMGKQTLATFLVSDSDVQIRKTAINVIRKINLETLGKNVEIITRGFSGYFTPPNFDKRDVTQLLNVLVESKDTSDRFSAVLALKASSEAKPEIVVPALIKILTSDPEPSVRAVATEALGEMGLEAKDSVPYLEHVLENDKDAQVRTKSAFSLGRIWAEINNKTDLEVQKTISLLSQALLKDQSADVRASAAQALGMAGIKSQEITQALTQALNDKASLVQGSAALSLGQIGIDARMSMSALSKTYSDVKDFMLREMIVESIGQITIAIQERKGTLSVTELEESIQDIEKAFLIFEKEGVGAQRLSTIRVSLKDLKEEINSRWSNQLLKGLSLTWLAHALFWLALIFAYPKSPQVQAIFFWNPWVRNVFGLGYVPFLLAWVPFLRRKLFEPFRVPLLADAGLDQFNPAGYFADMTVKSPGIDESQPLTTAIPAIQGQKILEGESGLGKTMFVRHLLRQSQRIVVYLPATRCTEGVIEAIQKKLHSDEIKDPKFLQSLIYSGAIDICIDGLNEVSADTRAKITQFVESHFRGNILITNQSLEWTPPATAKTYVLQPLRRDQIEQYLRSRQPVLPQTAPVQDTAYAEACRNFVTQQLDNPQLSAEEQKAAQMVLSNPMELTLVAAMLAGGNVPDLFRLREQQYTLMAAEYQRLWNQPFPLPSFSEAVYQLRLADKSALPATEFYNELVCMEDEKYKMVISRQGQDAEGKPRKEWTFRHDKIAEFFIVQTFLGDTYEAERRLEKHMGDPRFRGVYFLLATLLPLDIAQRLREDLIQYAADTKDHSVSDTFVQLLRSR